MSHEVHGQPSVAGQVFRRVGSKLLIVGLAVAAFFGLNSLEAAKTSYRKDQLAPLVIGDFGANATKRGDKPENARAIGLDYREVQKLLRDVLYPSTEDELVRLKKTLAEKKYAETVVNSIAESPVRMRAKILHSISRAATVKDENALIGSITTNIDEARAAEEKRATDERDARVAGYKNLSVSYADPKAFVEQFSNDENLRDVLQARLNAGGVNVANLLETATQEENTRFDQKVVEINGFAHINYGRVYSTSFPQTLTDYVERQRLASLNQNDFASRILDDRRGEYAIYQAGYLTCIVLLVFGLLYPVYLLLRLLPPFAPSLVPLTDQAKAIISGRTAIGSAGALAAPGIAKTLALSAAAVGIGTAVAVANNGPSPTSKQSVAASNITQREGDLINDPRIRKILYEIASDREPATPPDPSELKGLEERLNRRIDDILTGLPGDGSGGVNPEGLARAEALAALQSRFDGLGLTQADVAKLKEDSSKFNHLYDQTLDINFPDLKTRTADIGIGDATRFKAVIPQLETRTGNLETKTVGLETKATQLETQFFKRLDDANSRILGVRDDSFIGSQGSQGRNFFSRMKQLFRERYMATNQSYRVMENLMCEKPVWPGDPTLESCRSADSRNILKELRALIGKEARGESGFLSALGASASPWKRALLRYNRQPY